MAAAPVEGFIQRNKRFDDLFQASPITCVTEEAYDVKLTKNLEYWRDLADQASQKASRALTAVLAAAKAGEDTLALTSVFADLVAEEQYAAFHFIYTWARWKGISPEKEKRRAVFGEVFGDYLYLAEAWVPFWGFCPPGTPLPPYPSAKEVAGEYDALLRLAAADAPAEKIQAAEFSVQKAVEGRTMAAMHYVCHWADQTWPRFIRRDASNTIVAMAPREHCLQYIFENLEGDCEFGHLAMVLLASSFP